MEMSMSNTSLYQSKVEIPKEWIEKIELCHDSGSLADTKALQRCEFIKMYHGKKTRKDIAEVLGINERTVYKIVKKLKKKGEIV